MEFVVASFLVSMLMIAKTALPPGMVALTVGIMFGILSILKD